MRHIVRDARRQAGRDTCVRLHPFQSGRKADRPIPVSVDNFHPCEMGRGGNIDRGRAGERTRAAISEAWFTPGECADQRGEVGFRTAGREMAPCPNPANRRDAQRRR